MSNSSLFFTKWTTFIFILVFAGIAVFESIVVKLSSFAGELSKWSNIDIFIVFFMIYSISSILLLISINKTLKNNRREQLSRGNFLFRQIIITSQILTISIILVIVFQMILQDKYSLLLLQVQTILSRISGLVLLAPLIYLFASWLISKRNYTIVLYTLGFALLAINLVISLNYIIRLQSYYMLIGFYDVKYFPIAIYGANIPATVFTETLAFVFDLISLTAFLCMWTATLISLIQYQYRIGKIKYFIVLILPLIYYVFPFHNYISNIVSSWLQSYPVSYNVVFVLMFNASEQVGAVLFSLVFWTSSSLVYNTNVQKNLLISTIGMVIIFGSIEISNLQYHLFPPFGLVTQAFIPLGAYLLFIGTFTSAKQISADAKLRKDFYSTAKSRLNLLRTIGVTQMEKELIRSFKSAEKRTKYIETAEDNHTDENIQQIVREVLEELKERNSKQGNNDESVSAK